MRVLGQLGHGVHRRRGRLAASNSASTVASGRAAHQAATVASTSFAVLDPTGEALEPRVATQAHQLERTRTATVSALVEMATQPPSAQR